MKKELVAAVLGIAMGAALSSQAALVHHFNFDDGTASDSVGTATSTVGAGATLGGAGKYSKGAFFGGTQDGSIRISVPLPNTIALNAVGTHMFWFRTASEQNLAGDKDISGWAWHAGDDPGAGVFHGKQAHVDGVSGRLAVEVFDNPPSKNLAGNTENVTFGEWHHVAVARNLNDNGRVALYVDGSLASDKQAAPDNLLAESTGMGFSWSLGATGQNADRSYHGTIDEYKIFDAFLTESEVQTAMIPEPSVLALLGLAGLLLSLRRRK